MTGAEKNLLPAADGLLDDEHLAVPPPSLTMAPTFFGFAILASVRATAAPADVRCRGVGFVQREGRGTSPWAEGGTGQADDCGGMAETEADGWEVGCRCEREGTGDGDVALKPGVDFYSRLEGPTGSKN